MARYAPQSVDYHYVLEVVVTPERFTFALRGRANSKARMHTIKHQEGSLLLPHPDARMIMDGAFMDLAGSLIFPLFEADEVRQKRE